MAQQILMPAYFGKKSSKMADQDLPPSGRFLNDALVNLFQSSLKQLISDLGRTVTFVLTPLRLDCPNCGWDFSLNRSNNIHTSNASGVIFNKLFPTGGRCPVCKGRGKLDFQRSSVHKSLIGFGPAPEEFDYEVFGLKPTEVVRLKNGLGIVNDLDKAQFAKIDGIEYEKIAFPRKTGLRDLAFVITYWKRRNT